MRNIQSKLQEAFSSSGLTYDELAKRTNLPKSALYRYINGDTEKIPIDRFQAICSELHADARDLLGWTEEPPPMPVPTIRIVSGMMEKMNTEQQEQVLNVIRAMFANHPELLKVEEEYDDT